MKTSKRKIRDAMPGRPSPFFRPAVQRSTDDWLTGQPLDSTTRAFMESRFGHDFSDVRVHTDQEATERTATLGARAFTQGSHIFFGSHEFDAQSRAGRTLIGHELAHVAQNRAGAPSAPALLIICVSSAPLKKSPTTFSSGSLTSPSYF